MPTYAFSPETFDGPYSTIPIAEVDGESKSPFLSLSHG